LNGKPTYDEASKQVPKICSCKETVFSVLLPRAGLVTADDSFSHPHDFEVMRLLRFSFINPIDDTVLLL
jgi:hypothetical protein